MRQELKDLPVNPGSPLESPLRWLRPSWHVEPETDGQNIIHRTNATE